MNNPLPRENSTDVIWESGARQKFNQLIEKVPVFLRGMAEDKISKKAEQLVREDGRRIIEEKDMVDAFFSETPFGFHGPMKSDMEEIGIDYTRYGHPK